MKTLKESLLDDIETTLATGEDDLKAELSLDLNTIPTPKDFETTRGSGRIMYRAHWHCPNVIERYRSKYGKKLIQFASTDSIIIVLYAKNNEANEKICKFELYFGVKDIKYGISPREKIEGWETVFTNQSTQACKKKAIEIVTKLSKNPDKMDKMMEYANSKYTSHKKSFNEL